jgi:hypothetical protein
MIFSSFLHPPTCTAAVLAAAGNAAAGDLLLPILEARLPEEADAQDHLRLLVGTGRPVDFAGLV